MPPTLALVHALVDALDASDVEATFTACHLLARRIGTPAAVALASALREDAAPPRPSSGDLAATLLADRGADAPDNL